MYAISTPTNTLFSNHITSVYWQWTIYLSIQIQFYIIFKLFEIRIGKYYTSVT